MRWDDLEAVLEQPRLLLSYRAEMALLESLAPPAPLAPR